MIRTRRGISIGLLLWLVIGVIIAVVRDYITTPLLQEVASALLAILLWPLLLLGVDLHIS
jgi:hypothetical protein